MSAIDVKPRIECARCGSSDDLPENFSIARLVEIGKKFLVEHTRKHPLLEDQQCKEENLFVRTFEI